MAFGIPRGGFDPPHPAFHLQFQIDRTRAVSVKTVFESAGQLFQMKMIGTALIGRIKERTLWSRFAGTHRGSSAILDGSGEEGRFIGLQWYWKTQGDL
jgi:hypothetical protein